ncbi:MAG: elongation factor P [Candidatus Omnitrophota bacterium]
MIGTEQFKNGLTIKIDGNIYQIVEFQHVKPGKGGAFVRTKLRDLITKRIIDKTFRAGEKFDEAFIEDKKMQYLYPDDKFYHFMDQQTYEQCMLNISDIPETVLKFLKENMEVRVLFHAQTPIEVNLPIFVELKVEHTEMGLKGDTAKSAMKPATLETGTVISVPLFVTTGDIIKIDTRSGEYVGRI